MCMSLRVFDRRTQAAQDAWSSAGLAELSPNDERVGSNGVSATNLGLSRMTRVPNIGCIA